MNRKLEDAVRGAAAVSYVVGAVVVGLMMLHITAHVFAQYVIGFPLPGTVLLISHYYMVVVTFICLAAVDLKDGHVSVDLVTSRLNPRLRNILAGFSYLVTAVIFCLLAWQGFLAAEGRRAAGTFAIEYEIKFLIWPSYYLVPLGAGFFAFTSICRFIFLVTGYDVRSAHSASIAKEEF